MKQQYIDLYKTHSDSIKKHAPEIMNSRRDEAFTRFSELGFPASGQEDYRYSDFTKALAIDYGLNLNRLKIPIHPNDIFTCSVPGIKSYLYYIVNDTFRTPSADKNEPLPEGVIIGSLKECAMKYPDLVGKYYGKLSRQKNDGFIAFNEAFTQDGYFIYIPENTEPEQPIQIVNILRSDVDLMVNSRNLIVIEKAAKAKILVCDHSLDDVRFFTNRLTEVFVGENAVYEHYKLESTHEKTGNVSTLLVEQQASSNVLTNIITLHNGVTRNNIEIALNGEQCQTLLCGMVLSDKEQRVDNFTSILHNKPDCHSNELFKYILDDNSVCGFTGRLIVAKDAQKTQAYQNNRNIMLTPTSRMRTKPQLEIYADDVRCSHGATIGQLDENALFYMRSRGISTDEARLLLMYAFTADVVENIRIDALRDRIKKMVENRLRGESHKCTGCSICT
ncbi:MAG: Fe-S cluster assembly protein SufD [Prevotellaceae bacterium]|jgi:Fe-S cluster assembly protein SufD|nr:Fe-S cluster assembly protein SufD [Prevotellaceae bacterium]